MEGIRGTRVVGEIELGGCHSLEEAVAEMERIKVNASEKIFRHGVVSTDSSQTDRGEQWRGLDFCGMITSLVPGKFLRCLLEL